MIRVAEEKDFDSIYDFCKKNKACGRVMPVEIRQRIRYQECIVSVHRKEIIGFVIFHKLKNNFLTIYVIYVVDNYRSNNVGTAMINHLISLYGVNIKAICVKDTEGELFWKSLGIKNKERRGKVNMLCEYIIPCKRRNLLNGF